MKAKYLFFTLIISLFSFQTAFAQSGSELDNERGSSMVPIMVDADTVIRLVESEGYEIVRIEFDLLKTKKMTYRTLYPGWEYGVFVFGDYRFKEVGLEVSVKTKEGWKSLGKGTADGRLTSFNFEPEVESTYRFTITTKTFEGDHNAGHYGFILFHP